MGEAVLRRLGDLGLKAKIILFTVVLFLSAIWLLARDLSGEVYKSFQEVLAAQQQATVEHIAGNIAEATALRLGVLNEAASAIRPEWLGDRQRLHLFFYERTLHYRIFDAGIFVISPQGLDLADIPDLAGREGSDFSADDFFRQVMATGAPAIGQPLQTKFMKEPIIPLAVPMKDRAGRIVAVLVGANRIVGNDLFDDISSRTLHTGGELRVVSLRDNVIVSSTEAGRILGPLPAAGVNHMLDRYRAGFEGSGVSRDSRGIENLCSGKRVGGTDWMVIASLPTDIAFKPVDVLQHEIYVDTALASLGIVALLWLFLHRQITPLKRAADSLDAMTQGSVSLRPLVPEGSLEIRRLLESFNRLQAHIGEQKQSLRDNAEQLRLAASVFDGTSEAVLVSDAENRILRVNQAFCDMTGYTADELVGQNPRILRSERHDAAFYRDMWDQLKRNGYWRGEIWNRRKDGRVYPERITITRLCDENGEVVRHIAIAADVTQQKQAEEVIWRQANFNHLTGLPNRRMATERIQGEIRRHSLDGKAFALLHIDLDHFKEINDTLGQQWGNQLIADEAGRIVARVDHGDIVAHVGGDEFVIILAGLSDMSRVDAVAGRILRATAEPFRLGNEMAYITASIGIAFYPGDADDAEGLLMNAGQALGAAKAQGRNCHRRFTESMRVDAQLRTALAVDLRTALAARQFEVHYQPIVELAGGRIVKAEALLRWNHPERGAVSPAQFVPIAEETGLINDIGDWVFREAAAMAKRWCGHCSHNENGVCGRTATNAACTYQISVNKSPRQFFTGSTDRAWLSHLREIGLPPQCMTIEITEGLLLDHHPEVMEKFMAFRDAGIQVALDDFGTGYSAMSYLKKFDIDYIKIDRSFVRDMVANAGDRAIAEAVIVMAHKLGLRVVAEGIETEAQRDLLVAAGCDFGQGYLFAKPMPAADFADLILTSQQASGQLAQRPVTVR